MAVLDDDDKRELVAKSAARQAREARDLMRSPITRKEIIPIKRRSITEARRKEFEGGYRRTRGS